MEIGEQQPLKRKERKQNLILLAVKDVAEVLEKAGIKHFVLGSLARNAYMGRDPRSPEIDLLVPNQAERLKADEIIKEKLQPAHPDIQIDTSLSSFIHEEDGSYRLTHGKISYPIDPDLMVSREVQYGEAKFRSLVPATLLHTYTVVGGPFRPKDWRSALVFARWMRQSGIKYDDSLYACFHKFGQDRWKKSPLRLTQHGWRNLVNSLPDGIREVILEDIYQLPIAKRARAFFNRLEVFTCGGP